MLQKIYRNCEVAGRLLSSVISGRVVRRKSTYVSEEYISSVVSLEE
jgi:hypothetical protein